MALELLQDSEVVRELVVLDGGWDANCLDDAQAFLRLSPQPYLAEGGETYAACPPHSLPYPGPLIRTPRLTTPAATSGSRPSHHPYSLIVPVLTPSQLARG